MIEITKKQKEKIVMIEDDENYNDITMLVNCRSVGNPSLTPTVSI
jgi:hypothetical protein